MAGPGPILPSAHSESLLLARHEPHCVGPEQCSCSERSERAERSERSEHVWP